MLKRIAAAMKRIAVRKFIIIAVKVNFPSTTMVGKALLKDITQIAINTQTALTNKKETLTFLDHIF
jgi:hypothetical protein